MIPVECYFALSALLFFIGVYGFVTRRNLIEGGAEWQIGKFNTKTK